MKIEGLTQTETDVLRIFLRNRGFATSKQIGDELDVSKSRVSQIIGDLKEKGLEIERTVDKYELHYEGERIENCKLNGQILDDAQDIITEASVILGSCVQEVATDEEVEKWEESVSIMVSPESILSDIEFLPEPDELKFYGEETEEFREKLEDIEEKKDETYEKMGEAVEIEDDEKVRKCDNEVQRLNRKEHKLREELYEKLLHSEDLEEKYIPEMNTKRIAKWIGSTFLSVLCKVEEMDYSDNIKNLFISEFAKKVREELEAYDTDLDDFEGLVHDAFVKDVEGRGDGNGENTSK